jgi:uncharacterized protein (DUF2236 family)
LGKAGNILIGSLEPLTYAGTMLSTRSQNLPFLRLARTAKIQETVLLGTREEADRALASVHKLHESVEGSLPLTAGKHSPGTRYTALDPELMLWTLAVIADSARAMFELLIRPLSRRELEGLWRDYVLFGKLVGSPRDAARIGGGAPDGVSAPRAARRSTSAASQQLDD